MPDKYSIQLNPINRKKRQKQFDGTKNTLQILEANTLVIKGYHMFQIY